MRTMHFAPEDVLVAMEVNLKDGLDTDKIEVVIDKIEHQVIQVLPYINPSKIYIELEQAAAVQLITRKARIRKSFEPN